MNKKYGTLALIISVIALCLSVVSLVRTPGAAQQPVQQEAAQQAEAQPADTQAAEAQRPDAQAEGQDIQYVMYLGTNDKDTNEPVCSPEEARERAEDILIEHFGGYTIQEAHGGWEYEGTRYQEYTLVIYLSDTTIDAVHAAADDMIKAFNQSSVLIQANTTSTEFYSAENS